MPSAYTFTDPRLAKLDGFKVEIDEAHERADIILGRPPYNVVAMPQRDQLRLTFETLDEDPRVRVIVVRGEGEHFSSGGNIGGFMEASPEHVSKLAWNIAAPARCAKPVIVVRGDVPSELGNVLRARLHEATDIATAGEMLALAAHDDHADARILVQRLEGQAQLVALRHRHDVVGRTAQNDVGALMRLVDLDLEPVELGEPGIGKCVG